MQERLVSGDSLNFSTTTPGYSAADGWVLKFRLVPRTAGNNAIDLTSEADGEDHRTQVAAAVTAGWTPDTYGWAGWVEKGTEKYTVQSGQIVVKPDPRTAAAGLDSRSEARKALDQAKAALASWTPTTRRYRIGDREREFNSAAEIIKLITYWEQKVQEEDRLAGRAETIGRRIYTRL